MSSDGTNWKIIVLFIIVNIAVAMGVAGALLGMAGAGLITGISSTTIIFIATFIFALLSFFLLDKKMRTLITYAFKSVGKWFKNLFGNSDPMEMLKKQQEEIRQKLVKMSKNLNKLRAQLHKMKEHLYNNNEGMKENLRIAHESKEQGDETRMVIHTRKASRLKESSKKIKALYDRIQQLYKTIDKMYGNSLIFYEDIKDQVSLKQREHEAILSGHSAMQSASDILKGKGDKHEEFEATLDALNDDISKKVGEMEQFMHLSENFMNEIDLEKDIAGDKGMKLLQKWEQKASEILVQSDSKTQFLDDGQEKEDYDLEDLEESAQKEKQISKENRYDSFFDF